jgi:hypothetical protein
MASPLEAATGTEIVQGLLLAGAAVHRCDDEFALNFGFSRCGWGLK